MGVAPLYNRIFGLERENLSKDCSRYCFESPTPNLGGSGKYMKALIRRLMRKRTYQREQATQYSSHLRSPETLQDTYVLERMPVDIMLCISDNRLRQAVGIRPWELSRCERWKVPNYLESSLQFGHTWIPKRLGCAFRRVSHPQAMFGLRNIDVVHDIECLKLLNRHPFQRYCWLHVPKRIEYAPTFRDTLQKPSGHEHCRRIRG